MLKYSQIKNGRSYLQIEWVNLSDLPIEVMATRHRNETEYNIVFRETGTSRKPTESIIIMPNEEKVVRLYAPSLLGNRRWYSGEEFELFFAVNGEILENRFHHCTSAHAVDETIYIFNPRLFLPVAPIPSKVEYEKLDDKLLPKKKRKIVQP